MCVYVCGMCEYRLARECSMPISEWLAYMATDQTGTRVDDDKMLLLGAVLLSLSLFFLVPSLLLHSSLLPPPPLWIELIFGMSSIEWRRRCDNVFIHYPVYER